jgi:hypothetical protein
MYRYIWFVLLAAVSFAHLAPTFCHAGIKVPGRIVEVVHYVPSRQELQRLSAAGVEFLFVALQTYPDRFQARDLASFTGQLTVIIDAPSTPDSFQVMGLNTLTGPVWLMLSRTPDLAGANRINELTNDVKLYVRTTEYPAVNDMGVLNRIARPFTLVVSKDYPDNYAADKLNQLGEGKRVILNVNRYLDAFTLRTLNRVTRPVALYINRSASPGSSQEAGYLAQLNANFTVFIGRVFSPASVLERLLIALENR